MKKFENICCNVHLQGANYSWDSAKTVILVLDSSIRKEVPNSDPVYCSFCWFLVHTHLPLYRCYPTGHWYYCFHKIVKFLRNTIHIHKSKTRLYPLLQGKGCPSSSYYYGKIFNSWTSRVCSDSHPQAANICFKLKLLHMDCRLVKAMKTAMLSKLQEH